MSLGYEVRERRGTVVPADLALLFELGRIQRG
jgi:hypothetical protein